MDHTAMTSPLQTRLEALRETLGRVSGAMQDARAIEDASSAFHATTTALAAKMASGPAAVQGLDRASVEALRDDLVRMDARLRAHVQVLSGFGSYLKADIARG
ncbi:MAG: hypothetical protein FJX19_00465 [Alphaproteobacteria bacterium]|nr:hypothetical protein [Alphaproteobacteria bacterium]